MPTRTTRNLRNLDSTGTKAVRKGCVIEWPGGFTATVTRVCNGRFSTSTTHHFSLSACSSVRVIQDKTK